MKLKHVKLTNYINNSNILNIAKIKSNFFKFKSTFLSTNLNLKKNSIFTKYNSIKLPFYKIQCKNVISIDDLQDINHKELSKEEKDKVDSIFKNYVKQQQEEQQKYIDNLKRLREEEALSGKRSFLHKMIIPEVDPKPDKCYVEGYTDGKFIVNNTLVPGSLLVFPNRYYMWGVADAHDIRTHTLDIFKVIKPKPTYLIIGTGKYHVEFKDSFFKYFENYKIKVSTMPTYEAIVEFNMHNEDNHPIAAALIPENM